MKPDANTEAELKAELKVALQNQTTAIKQFRRVIREIPSGLPHSDGSKRILQASHDVSKAHSAIVSLLLKLNKGSLDGDGKKKRR